MRRVLLTLALLTGAAALAACGSEGSGDAAASGPEARAVAAAEGFLDRYVEDDGRVVRRDQGGDTVSEGQAYALLLAVAADDEERFDSVWSWTQDELQRDDGLLSWLWRDGRVVDPQPASDADLDIARALTLAAGRFDRDDLGADARRIARALRREETVGVPAGRALVAGPWAAPDRVANPSYVSPRAARTVRTLGEPLRRGDVVAVRSLLADRALPSDWARLSGRGRMTPMPSPGDRDARPVYGFDAVRTPIRLAEACEPDTRRLAARMWPALRERPERLPRSLGGAPRRGAYETPVALVGAAGAAHAAGEREERRRLLDRATAMDRRAPTYYSGAWVALGRVMLTTDLLGRCR